LKRSSSGLPGWFSIYNETPRGGKKGESFDMCGIFGIVTAQERDLGETLRDAARRLSYRGYDSVGFAMLPDAGPVDLRKDVGKVDEVAERYRVADMRGRRGMVQLRWATFGAPSQINAQPHLDSDGFMVGAHNGNVVNNVELRSRFLAEGLTVRSTNDGESCVHAVERHLKRGLSMVDAIRGAHADLHGDYAFILGRRGEERLWALKKGSGLVAGLGEGFTCAGSDLPCLLPLTRRVVRVQDGEILELSSDGVRIFRVEDGAEVARSPEEVTESMEAAEKGGYPHFMLKEIHEQPKVAADLIHLLADSPHVRPFARRVKAARNLYLVGCGTSYHACLMGAVYLARLAGRPAIPVLAPQFLPQYAATIGPEDVVLCVSQSGETKDVLNAMEAARLGGAQILGLVNVLGSTLMNVSDRYLPLACGYEISVPATKTFVNTVIAFLCVALVAGGHDTAPLAELPGLLERTLEETEPLTKEAAERLKDKDDLYCLGYGLTYAIALEGSLKLKEITYAHCEGMLSTEFKHGPLSAVREGYPVLFVAGPEDVPLMVSGVNECACRGAATLAVAEPDERLWANVRHFLPLPISGPLFAPVLAVLPLQVLAYRISVARGVDPDFPRNLSKTLTVD
jgi:glucosamine--fructose-6-phosphate aminotransferase (isomerizing)